MLGLGLRAVDALRVALHLVLGLKLAVADRARVRAVCVDRAVVAQMLDLAEGFLADFALEGRSWFSARSANREANLKAGVGRVVVTHKSVAFKGLLTLEIGVQ